MTETLEHHSSMYIITFVGCATLSKNCNQFKSTSPKIYLIKVIMRITVNNTYKYSSQLNIWHILTSPKILPIIIKKAVTVISVFQTYLVVFLPPSIQDAIKVGKCSKVTHSSQTLPKSLFGTYCLSVNTTACQYLRNIWE